MVLNRKRNQVYNCKNNSYILSRVNLETTAKYFSSTNKLKKACVVFHNHRKDHCSFSCPFGTIDISFIVREQKILVLEILFIK